MNYSAEDYLNQLDVDKETMVDALIELDVTCDNTETFTELVTKYPSLIAPYTHDTYDGTSSSANWVATKSVQLDLSTVPMRDYVITLDTYKPNVLSGWCHSDYAPTLYYPTTITSFSDLCRYTVGQDATYTTEVAQSAKLKEINIIASKVTYLSYNVIEGTACLEHFKISADFTSCSAFSQSFKRIGSPSYSSGGAQAQARFAAVAAQHPTTFEFVNTADTPATTLTRLYEAFQYQYLDNIIFTNFDLSNITDFSKCFEYAGQYYNGIRPPFIDNHAQILQQFSNAKPTNIKDMFGHFGYTGTDTIDLHLENLDLSRCTSAGQSYMKVTNVYLGNQTLSNNDLRIWNSYYSTIGTVHGTITCAAGASLSYFFSGESIPTNYDLTFINMENITNFSYIVYMSSYKFVDVTKSCLPLLNTRGAVNMNHMFYNTSGSYTKATFTDTTLDFTQYPDFKTDLVTDMSYWMYGIAVYRNTDATDDSIKLDISSLNTSAVQNMSHMLNYISLTRSEYIDESHTVSRGYPMSPVGLDTLDTSSVTDMSYMLAYNSNLLADIVAVTWNTANVTNMEGMFLSMGGDPDYTCLSNINTNAVTNFKSFVANTLSTTYNMSFITVGQDITADVQNMFNNCKNATLIDIRNLDLSKTTNTAQILGASNTTTPTGCTIIVSNATDKATLQAAYPNFTNIMTAAEYAAL